jgi:hypothetical protein
VTASRNNVEKDSCGLIFSALPPKALKLINALAGLLALPFLTAFPFFQQWPEN